jgi:hypothetical protein
MAKRHRRGYAYIEDAPRPTDPLGMTSDAYFGCDACGLRQIRNLPATEAELLALMNAHVQTHAHGHCVGKTACHGCSIDVTTAAAARRAPSSGAHRRRTGSARR